MIYVLMDSTQAWQVYRCGHVVRTLDLSGRTSVMLLWLTERKP